MNQLDLFSGIGGFALAARWCGIRTLAFVEKDSYCQAILRKRFPNIPIYNDIKNYIYKGGENVDIITGGFPCQDISVQGKRKGLSGERSGLWSEFKRCIEETKPRYAIVENVKNLQNLGLATILKDLNKIGYDAEWHIIPARAVGAIHQRERVFIIAYHRGERIERQLFKSIQRESCFSWLENVRGIEDLRNRSSIYTPTLCGANDGIPNRSHRLKAVGNAIVPQIAKQIFQSIIETNG